MRAVGTESSVRRRRVRPVPSADGLRRLATVPPRARVGVIGAFVSGPPGEVAGRALRAAVRAACSPFDQLLELPNGYLLVVQGGERRLARVRAELRRRLRPLAGQVELRFGLGPAAELQQLLQELADPAPAAG